MYPEIETIGQLVKHIMLVGLSIPYDILRDGRDIGLSFDCSWDEEDGLGVRLINEKVDDVGHQEIAV